MRVLVAHASKHGSTTGIADRIANRLEAEGIDTVSCPVEEVRDLDAFDAFVVGSAVYVGHWMKEATAFVRRHRDVLSERPVWVFASGPVGTEKVDKEGNDILEVSRPREFGEFATLIRPRDQKVFFGAFDPGAAPIGMLERTMRLAPTTALLPAGDFRDWDAIDAWAGEIAADVRTLSSSFNNPATEA